MINEYFYFQANISDLEDVYEIVVSMFFCMEDMPQILMNPDDPKVSVFFFYINSNYFSSLWYILTHIIFYI